MFTDKTNKNNLKTITYISLIGVNNGYGKSF